MSGGHFDYNQYKIGEIRQEIQSILSLGYVGSEEYEEWREPLSPVAIAILTDAVAHLKTAETYANRIDWWLSGDDSEDTMFKRLHEELT